MSQRPTRAEAEPNDRRPPSPVRTSSHLTPGRNRSMTVQSVVFAAFALYLSLTATILLAVLHWVT